MVQLPHRPGQFEKTIGEDQGQQQDLGFDQDARALGGKVEALHRGVGAVEIAEHSKQGGQRHHRGRGEEGRAVDDVADQRGIGDPVLAREHGRHPCAAHLEQTYRHAPPRPHRLRCRPVAEPSQEEEAERRPVETGQVVKHQINQGAIPSFICGRRAASRGPACRERWPARLRAWLWGCFPDDVSLSRRAALVQELSTRWRCSQCGC